MLPIKYIRSLTNDRRAQEIGSAISATNNKAAEKYLEAVSMRRRIEREAADVHINLKPKYPLAEKWIDNEWSTYYRNPRVRQLMEKRIDKVYREILKGKGE